MLPCGEAGRSALAKMAATVAASEPCIEIVSERRRAHDAAFRAQLVAASQLPGARVHELARQHGLCPSLIYRWRRAAAARRGLPAVQPERAASAKSGAARVAQRPPEFVPIGVFGRAEDKGPALVAGPARCDETWAAPGRARPHSAMDERPGLIEIDLADGTRLRVDAFVNERALRRVLAVLRASA